MKRLIAGIIILLSILVVGCGIKPRNIENTKGTDIVATNTENTNIKNSNICRISEGKVDTIEFGIGDKVVSILKSWGEPDIKDDFMGGSYISYDKITFFVDKYIDDIENGKIVRIGFSTGYEFLGIKVGMRFEEIKTIIGTPSFEGIIGNDEGELFGESMAIIYESGDYKLLFIGDKGSDVADQAYLDIKD